MVTHHPDGVLWPRQRPGGSEALPVVLLEVQMHPDRRFHRRLGAKTFRLLQQHEEVEHLQVLVLLAHRRLGLGSNQPLLLRRILEQDVTWVDLQALARQLDLDPLLALLTLPVQKEPDLGLCANWNAVADRLMSPPSRGSKSSACRNWKSWPCLRFQGRRGSTDLAGAAGTLREDAGLVHQDPQFRPLVRIRQLLKD